MKKDLLIVFALLLIVALLVSGVEIKSVEEYYLEHSEDVGEGDPSVTLSIHCDLALASERLDPAIRAALPSDGVILPPTRLRLRDGDSVYDLLSRAVRTHRIRMEISRAAGAVYVKGIADLYEKDAGDLAGWVFRVGTDAPSRDASSVKPSDGDTVEWLYTLDLGRDLA